MTIRVDLVLFVNGIPLGVIEVKASHVSSDKGVSQQIRNQKTGEGVPALFYRRQLLVAANAYDPQLRHGRDATEVVERMEGARGSTWLRRERC